MIFFVLDFRYRLVCCWLDILFQMVKIIFFMYMVSDDVIYYNSGIF